MRALILFGPGDYGVRKDWPEPVEMGNTYLVRVRWCGICGSDLPRFLETGSYHHPVILGHEFSGTIEKAPAGGRYQEGDAVAVLPIMPCGRCDNCRAGKPAFYCNSYRFIGSRNDGGFAEFCAVPEENLFPITREALQTGALIEPMAVGLHVIRRSGFLPGKSAAVFGAGPIGLMVAYWLQRLGAIHVRVLDIRKFSVDIARNMGMDGVLISKESLEVLPEYDYLYEAAGSNVALVTALGKLNAGGRLTVVGRETGDTTIPHSVFERTMRKEADIRGCFGYDLRGDEALLRQVLSEPLPFEHMISHRTPLEQAPDVIRRMGEREIEYCKVLIDMEAGS